MEIKIEDINRIAMEITGEARGLNEKFAAGAEIIGSKADIEMMATIRTLRMLGIKCELECDVFAAVTGGDAYYTRLTVNGQTADIQDFADCAEKFRF
jgi:hypothetical protein